jgi:hypothetical protein
MSVALTGYASEFLMAHAEDLGHGLPVTLPFGSWTDGELYILVGIFDELGFTVQQSLSSDIRSFPIRVLINTDKESTNIIAWKIHGINSAFKHEIGNAITDYVNANRAELESKRHIKFPEVYGGYRPGSPYYHRAGREFIAQLKDHGLFHRPIRNENYITTYSPTEIDRSTRYTDL